MASGMWHIASKLLKPSNGDAFKNKISIHGFANEKMCTLLSYYYSNKSFNHVQSTI